MGARRLGTSFLNTRRDRTPATPVGLVAGHTSFRPRDDEQHRRDVGVAAAWHSRRPDRWRTPTSGYIKGLNGGRAAAVALGPWRRGRW